MTAPYLDCSQSAAADLEPSEIAEGLRTWATGVATTEAAVELLIGHGAWLRRADFTELLWVEDDTIGFDPDELAGLVFLATASRSEVAVLQLAVGLLGLDLVDPLAQVLVSLDDPTLALVLEAAARCGGWHDRRQFYLVTGRFDVDLMVGS
jgi:hypothetical protein